MTDRRPAEAIDPRIRERLLDLAEEASFYLRRNREPSVRVAAALLLASSLAGCSRPPAPAPIAPLAAEVRDGLPTAPGRYPVDPSTLTRDHQGVYSLGWRQAAGAANNWTPARSSLMRMAQGTEDTLDVPASGDPTLYLRPNTPVSLIDPDGRDTPGIGPTPTPGRSSSTTSSTGRRSVAWYPFDASGASASSTSGSNVAATTPAYRDPPTPTQAQIAQGSVRGASSSLDAPATSARTWSTTGRATSGQAGGTGAGSAVAGRSGAEGGTAQGSARGSVSSGFSGGLGGLSGSSGG